MFNTDCLKECGKIRGVAFRIIWVLFSMLILPSIMLKICDNPPAALFISSFAGVVACIASAEKLVLKKITAKDSLYILCTFAIILFSVAILTATWKFILAKADISCPEKQALVELIANSNFQGRAMIFAATCLFAPFTEEVLFRRIIFDIWHKHHPKTAFAGTALFFSVIHFFLPGIPGLFFMGMAFQYIFLRRQNLWCACLTHALVNISAFAVNI